MIRLYLNIYRQYMNTLDIDIYLAPSVSLLSLWMWVFVMHDVEIPFSLVVQRQSSAPCCRRWSMTYRCQIQHTHVSISTSSSSTISTSLLNSLSPVRGLAPRVSQGTKLVNLTSCGPLRVRKDVRGPWDPCVVSTWDQNQTFMQETRAHWEWFLILLPVLDPLYL